MQADLKLFLEDELEWHIPLISPGVVRGARHLGPEGSTTPCLNVIWCNANTCSYHALAMQCHSSISMTSEDGTDWVEGALEGLDITSLHRVPGEGDNAL